MKRARLLAPALLASLLPACVFVADGEWLWGSTYYDLCWTSSDCTADTDGCFEVMVDYGLYSVGDRMCSAWCESDWDCPFDGACYAFPVRPLALMQGDSEGLAPACSAERRDQDVCLAPPLDGSPTSALPVVEAVPVATVASSRPAYEAPICFARCESDWDCPWGFGCVEVVESFFDAVCLPY